jgi:hypothetical protein
MRGIGDKTVRKIRNILFILIITLYITAFIDRLDVGFAAAQMQRDLSFSSYLYGFGADIFHWLLPVRGTGQSDIAPDRRPPVARAHHAGVGAAELTQTMPQAPVLPAGP